MKFKFALLAATLLMAGCVTDGGHYHHGHGSYGGRAQYNWQRSHTNIDPTQNFRHHNSTAANIQYCKQWNRHNRGSNVRCVPFANKIEWYRQ